MTGKILSRNAVSSGNAGAGPDGRGRHRRQVPHREHARHGRHGLRRQRAPSDDRRAGRDQDPPSGHGDRPRGGPAFRPSSALLGSPQYMAPEQMRASRGVDHRTDIWALGTILYELLTGKAPFVAGSMPELFAMILTDPTPSLRTKRPDVPEALDAIVMRCLEKDPNRRFQSIGELAKAIAPYGADG